MVVSGWTKLFAVGVGTISMAAVLLTSANAVDPYKVGMSIDLTGPISFNGKLAAAGFETYIAKINDAGGVNGRLVELTVADDASDLAKGKANAQRFADDGALAIFGFITSAVSAAVAPQAAEDKVPIVALGSLKELLEPAQPYYFTYELQFAKLSDRILGYIEERAKADGIASPRIALMVVDVPSNHQVAERAAAEIAQRGWVLAETQFAPVAPTDVTSQASAIKASNPDYIFLVQNDSSALIIVKALRSQGLTVPVVNMWAGSADATLQRLGENYFAFRTFTSPTDDSVPAIADMRAAGEKFGYAAQMTSPYFTQGYVAGMILQKTLETCAADCTNGDAFAKALEAVGEIETNGLAGPMKVSSTSHEFVDTVRFFTWDVDANKAKAVTDWIGASGE